MNYYKFTLLFICLNSLLINCSTRLQIEEVEKNRFEVLSYNSEISETLTLKSSEILLSEPKSYLYWTKNFQNPQNNISNIKTTAKFKNKKKIISRSSGYINLIQPIFFEENLCHIKKKGILVCKNTETNSISLELDVKPNEIKKYEVVRGGIAYFDDTIVFVDAYGQIKSINMIESEVNWETNIDFPILSPPLIYRGNIYFTSADNRVFSLSLKTGEVIWSFQTIEENKKNLFTASHQLLKNIKKIFHLPLGQLASQIQ